VRCPRRRSSQLAASLGFSTPARFRRAAPSQSDEEAKAADEDAVNHAARRRSGRAHAPSSSPPISDRGPA
jgi:hypothetical protein